MMGGFSFLKANSHALSWWYTLPHTLDFHELFYTFLPIPSLILLPSLFLIQISLCDLTENNAKYPQSALLKDRIGF